METDVQRGGFLQELEFSSLGVSAAPPHFLFSNAQLRPFGFIFGHSRFHSSRITRALRAPSLGRVSPTKPLGWRIRLVREQIATQERKAQSVSHGTEAIAGQRRLTAKFYA